MKDQANTITDANSNEETMKGAAATLDIFNDKGTLRPEPAEM